MNEFLDNQWWYGAAFVFYLMALGLSFQAETTYRKIFAMPPITRLNMILPSLTGLIALAALIISSHQQLPTAALACFATACGSLLGVYRIDRLLLIIPDRLQLLGSVAGVFFLIVIAVSGEELNQLGLEVLFALAMVLLLWGLSYLYLRIRGTIGFGLGDIKLLAWLALFTGKRMPDLILIAIGFGLLGLVLSIIKHLIRERELRLPKGQDSFAFGPAIVLAFLTEELIHYAYHA